MRPDQDVILCAARVACAAPREWAEFARAFKVFSVDEAAKCVASPPDRLSLMQGRAQQCASLSSLFADPATAASGVEKALAGMKAK